MRSSRRRTLATATPKSPLVAIRRPGSTARRDGLGHSDRYGHLMDAAASLFQPEELRRLVPRCTQPATSLGRNGQRSTARSDGRHRSDRLRLFDAGGKHSRPFITLAVYDALTGGGEPLPAAAEDLAELSDSIKRCALSIETFHKASLVHDDIQDDDQFRYGVPTLHRRFRHADSDQRRRLPDWARVSAGKPRAAIGGAGGRRSRSSIGWPSLT